MNSHIYNLQERTECNKVEPKLRLWVINYEITDIAKGAAVVKANNAKEASNILLADSQFNAYRSVFNIIRIEEILTDGMDINLAAEEWIEFNSNSTMPPSSIEASKIIYIPSNGMKSRNVQGAIDELNSNIKNIDIIEGPVGPKGDKGEKGDKMTYDDLTEWDKDDLASRVPAPDVDVPTKTSQLTNDSGYITEERVEEMIEDKVTSANVTNIVSITQADYDALETKDENTLYLITE